MFASFYLLVTLGLAQAGQEAVCFNLLCKNFAADLAAVAARLDADSIQKPDAFILLQAACRHLLRQARVEPTAELRQHIQQLNTSKDPVAILEEVRRAVGYRLGSDEFTIAEAALKPAFAELKVEAEVFDTSTRVLVNQEFPYDPGLSLHRDAFGVVRVLGAPIGSSAFRAGLRYGDEILRVEGPQFDDQVTALNVMWGMNADVVLRQTIGARRFPVRVRWRCAATGTFKEESLPRGHNRGPGPWVGPNPNTDGTIRCLLDEKARIGYLRLGVRNDGLLVGKQWRELLDQAALRGLILDLRAPQNAYLSGAIAIGEDLMDAGVILRITSRDAERAVTYDVRAPGRYAKLKVAVLVDESTKGALEALAASLQDHRRAVVVGSRSSGQVAISTIVEINGRLDLKFPRAVMQRPSGRNLSRLLAKDDGSSTWGVQPDAGLELNLPGEERRKLDHYLRAQEYVYHPQGPRPAWLATFHDRQRDLALDWLRKQLDP